jgi:hypothetical protein
MTSRSLWAGALAATILGGFGCGTSNRPADRLSVNDPKGKAADAALERARKLQMVRVTSGGDTTDVEASTMARWVRDACLTEVLASEFGQAVLGLDPPPPPAEYPSYSVLRSLASLCSARKLLGLAVPNRPSQVVVDLGPTPDVEYDVPPQSEATNARLAITALADAHETMYEAKNTIFGAYALETYVDSNYLDPEGSPHPLGDLLQRKRSI